MQIEFKRIKGWGGRRNGAGRKNLSQRLNHMPRERVDFKKPLHITQKIVSGCPSLRKRDFLNLFKKCAGRSKEFGIHVVHFSLLSNHIHMLVEAKDNESLGRGMRSLAIAFAKGFNEKLGRQGTVFRERYHLKVIRNPTQMKRVLEYVLLNQCKHTDMLEHMDPFSSAPFFPHWRRLLRGRWNDVLEWELPGLSTDLAGAGLSLPRSWLLRKGWMFA